jgi:hypothetical protein
MRRGQGRADPGQPPRRDRGRRERNAGRNRRSVAEGAEPGGRRLLCGRRGRPGVGFLTGLQKEQLLPRIDLVLEPAKPVQEVDANGRFLADPITHWRGREGRVWVGLSHSFFGAAPGSGCVRIPPIPHEKSPPISRLGPLDVGRVGTPAGIAGGGRQREEADFAYPRFNPRGGPLAPLPFGISRPPLRCEIALAALGELGIGCQAGGGAEQGVRRPACRRPARGGPA